MLLRKEYNMGKEIKSILILNKLVFDKIEFVRYGLKNDSEVEFQIQTGIGKKQNEDLYKVTLVLKGNKKDEYTIEISITGFFSFEQKEMPENIQLEELLSRNAVAILMPYLRSEVSLLTAQPEVDCVVLPPFDINKMMK